MTKVTSGCFLLNSDWKFFFIYRTFFKISCFPFFQVHCVTHRLNLAASQASHGIQYLEDYKSNIQSLYRFYTDSSVRYDKLRELQQLLHGKIKQVPEGTSVRWLSVESAVRMIYNYFDSIVLSLESDKDRTGKAAGLYRFVASALLF